MSFPTLNFSEVSACGVFDAFDGLVDQCGVGLESGDLLLVVSDGLDHIHEVAAGTTEMFYVFGDVVDEFELFVVLNRRG